MEKGLLEASVAEVCPEELEEPDLEGDPDALCACDGAQDKDSAAASNSVVRTEDRFIAEALFLLLAILRVPQERGQQSKIQPGGSLSIGQRR